MPVEGTKNLTFRLDVAALEDAFQIGGCPGLALEVSDVFECVTCDGAP